MPARSMSTLALTPPLSLAQILALAPPLSLTCALHIGELFAKGLPVQVVEAEEVLVGVRGRGER